MAWYQVKGKDSDVVLSSRVRFARNLADYRFDEKLTPAQIREIIEKVGAALGEEFTAVELDGASAVFAGSLVEQHLISRDFACRKGPHTLFRNDAKSVYVMTPEEDHIRLQCILPGLATEDAYRFACLFDDKLDQALSIAFDNKLGYLTHCPTNLGTGMRASVMLFLPMLAGGGYIASLAQQLSKVGLTMRGVYGEGSKPYGCLYQISNQVTLGLSEEDILHKLNEFVQSIIQKERALRNELKGEEKEALIDRICRAEGILRFATQISSEEFFSLYADLALGISLGVITTIPEQTLTTLLVQVMPATLCSSLQDTPKSAAERDRARATLIKKALEVIKHE